MAYLDDFLSKDLLEALATAPELAGGRSVDCNSFIEIVSKITGIVDDDRGMALFDLTAEQTAEGRRLRLSVLIDHAFIKLSEDAAHEHEAPPDLKLPVLTAASPHHNGSVVRTRVNRKHQLVSLSDDGHLCSWSQAPPTTTRDYTPVKSMTFSLGTKSQSTIRKNWVTDFVFAHKLQRLVIASGDRTLTFLEETHELNPTLVISHFPAMVTRLASHFDDKNRETQIIYGDAEGNLGVLVFPMDGVMDARLHPRSPEHGPPRIEYSELLTEVGCGEGFGGVHIRTWAAHTEWVTDLIWIPSLSNFASTSCDPHRSMIIGEVIGLEQGLPASLVKARGGNKPKIPRVRGHRVNLSNHHFSVSTGGIQVVSFSNALGMLATGGADRTVRIWSPLMRKSPQTLLSGHDGQIVSLSFHDTAPRLVSLDIQRNVRIWNVQSNSCQINIGAYTHRIHEEPQSICVNSFTNIIYIFFNRKVATLETVVPPTPSSHDLAHKAEIKALVVNEYQIVTACAKALVMIWNLQSGQLIFKFRAWPEPENTESPVTSMAFDHTGSRLMVAHEDGSVNLWKASNGMLVRKYYESQVGKDGQTVSFIVNTKVGTTNAFVTGGWSRRLNFYIDLDSIDAGDHRERALPNNSTTWRKRAENLHSDDITCAVSFETSGILATGDYKGEIIIWNLRSGVVIRRLTPQRGTADKCPQSAAKASWKNSGVKRMSLMSAASSISLNSGALSEAPIRALLELPQSRNANKNAATLVAASSHGIFFWNIKVGAKGTMMAQIPNPKEKACETDVLALSGDMLICGDTFGRVTIYDIENFAIGFGGFGKIPPVLAQWRAHETPISGLKVARDIPIRGDFVITASDDHRVRLWSLSKSLGKLVGTFFVGRQDWNLNDSGTWPKSSVPLEILVSDRAAEEEENETKRWDAMVAQVGKRRKSSAAWGLDEESETSSGSEAETEGESGAAVLDKEADLLSIEMLSHNSGDSEGGDGHDEENYDDVGKNDDVQYSYEKDEWDSTREYGSSEDDQDWDIMPPPQTSAPSIDSNSPSVRKYGFQEWIPRPFTSPNKLGRSGTAERASLSSGRRRNIGSAGGYLYVRSDLTGAPSVNENKCDTRDTRRPASSSIAPRIHERNFQKSGRVTRPDSARLYSAMDLKQIASILPVNAPKLSKNDG